VHAAAEKTIELVVFGWSGTLVDHGSVASVLALQQAFAHRGVRLIDAHAREPMGRGKREHIQAILAMPEIALQWRKVLGRPVARADVEALHRDFQVSLLVGLSAHARLTPGVLDALRYLRGRSTRVATFTAYGKQAADVVLAAAEAQGFVPDHALCAEDVSAGRPAPWLVFACMEALQVFPPARVVVVGDTLLDVLAARNAGCTSVAVARTGNEVGLSERDFAALDAAEQRAHVTQARAALRRAGAHFVIDTLAELPSVIEVIEERARPGGALLHAANAAARFVRSRVRPPHANMDMDS
jgi:phosphonoacetaldehyde hydrolase